MNVTAINVLDERLKYIKLRITRLTAKVETLVDRKTRNSNWTEHDRRQLVSSKAALARWNKEWDRLTGN